MSHLRNGGVVEIHVEVAFLPAVCLHSWLRAVWTVTIDGLTQSKSGRNQSCIISHEVFNLLPAGYCPLQWHVKQRPQSLSMKYQDIPEYYIITVSSVSYCFFAFTSGVERNILNHPQSCWQRPTRNPARPLGQKSQKQLVCCCSPSDSE